MSLRKILSADPSLDAATYATVEDIAVAARLLSKYSHINDDFAAVRSMHQDLKSLWKLDQLPDEIHAAYFDALMRSGRWTTAWRILSGRATGTIRQWSPPPAAWNAYLEVYIATRAKDFETIKQWVLENIPEEKRDAHTYHVLLRALVATHQTNLDLRHLQESLKWIESQAQCRNGGSSSNLGDTLRLDDAILRGYLDLGLKAESDAVRQKIMESEDLASLSEDTSVSLVRHACWRDDMQSAKQLTQEALRLYPDSFRLKVGEQLVRDFARTYDNIGQVSLEDARAILSRVENVTGLLPSLKAYEYVIRQTSKFNDACTLSRDARRDGIELSSGMVRGILSRLALVMASPENIEAVKALYADLGGSKLSDHRSEEGIHSPALYIALLQFCARQDVADLDWAMTLMEDMRAHGLGLLSSDEVVKTDLATELLEDLPTASVATTSAASIVVALMKHAPSEHTQAFKAYSWMWAIDPDHIFSKKDWYNVVRTYTDLRFTDKDGKPRQSYVASTVFFAFFEDMRKAGCPPDSPIYQAVLQYYAEEGAAFQKEAAEAVQFIHSMIKMDHYHDPDIGLMNRLMFAYSKTGKADVAIDVWRSILLNRIPFNNVSVSIILDAYGYTGQAGKIVKLWEALESQALPQQLYPVNKKNVLSLLEALGRTGNLELASQKVFQLMQKPHGQNLIDDQSILVLLKFARSDQRAFHQLRNQIEKDYPQFWPLVKDFGQTKAAIGPKADTAQRVDFRALGFQKAGETETSIKLVNPPEVSFQRL